MDDPELTFFKTELKFRDSDIQHTIDDAIKFFSNTYGLDFSDSPPNERNQRFLPNARMNPFMLIPGKLDFIVTDSRWIRTGSTHSSCYCIDFKKQDLISYTVATFYRSLPTGLHEVTTTL